MLKTTTPTLTFTEGERGTINESNGRWYSRPTLTTTHLLKKGRIMAVSQPIPTHGLFQDLTGHSAFGRLKVISFAGHNRCNQTEWNCLCKCGNECRVQGAHLRSGKTKSCGCLRIERVRIARQTHGLSGTPEKIAWANMVQRCVNNANPSFINYGGRGVTVCDRWLTFENFIADVGMRPTAKHTIDRFPDNDGNYEPGNVRWATRKQQQQNRRVNVMVTFRGKTQCLAAWAEELGIHIATIHSRRRLGWSDEKTLTQPVKTKRGVK